MSIAAKGWDHKLFRLGADLAVRLPRRAASAALVEQEQRWLPSLAARLPLPIPVPHRVGSPTDRYPWSWSVVPWFQGATALSAPLDDRAAAVRSLGGFLRALHHPAPPDAPRNPWRDSLASRTPLITERLTRLDTLVNGAAVIDLWNRVLSTPSWSGPRVWNHGDLHPGNLLVTSGRLSAVIDFGDLTAGDPAVDLSVAWMLFPHHMRPTFREAAPQRVQSD